MDPNMETVIFYTDLTWNFHVNANSGTQFCACLCIWFHVDLISFEIVLDLDEDVPLSSRNIQAYDRL